MASQTFMVRTKKDLLTSLRYFKKCGLVEATLGGLSFLGAASELTAQQPRVSSQPRLVHRWEVEPDLDASWLQHINKPAPILELTRFASGEAANLIVESQNAIRLANELNREDRTASLKSILEKLTTPDPNEQVQLSIVSAAIQLADASYAPELWEKLRDHNPSRRLLDPAMIKWKSPLALDDWRKRLTQSETPNSQLIVAIEGVAAVGNEQDLAVLETLLRRDRSNTTLKAVVARAMGSLAQRNLENLADDVFASGIDQHALIVAELLSRHDSDRARDLLGKVLKTGNNAARNVAYTAISRSFGAFARELAPEMLLQSNNHLRQQAIEVLNRFDDPESLRQQAIAMDDRNQTIRNTARENIEKKAQNAALKVVVDETITMQLKSDSPRAVVQSILLSVSLDQRERCHQLVALLDHPDMDVSITAAWGLQSIVDSPELLDLILKHTDLATQRLRKGEAISVSEFVKQAFLFEALGRNHYKPAIPSLKLYVPKSRLKLMNFTRATAIWAIGKIQEGSRDETTATLIAQRMLDRSDDDPEDPLVQFTSAIALGFIRAPGSIEQLNKVIDAPPSPIGLARDWSLKQIRDSKE